MPRPRTLPPALVPAVLAVLATALVVPIAHGAVAPGALAAQSSALVRTQLTEAQRAEPLDAERRLARDLRVDQRAAQAAAAAERTAADRTAAERTAADRASRSGRSAGDPRTIARGVLADRGQADQFACLDRLWVKESEWRVSAENPSSGAYGIPQALPAGKMASAGADWRTNPATQIRWGLGYIADRYGSPCAAWRHSQRNDWY